MIRIYIEFFAIASLCQFCFAGPSTQPHNQWHDTEYGQLMLKSFDTAPFPHPSRAKGYTHNGTTFGPEHYQDSTIGIVIFKNFHPTDSVDLIVHFHGFNNYVEGVLDIYQLPQQLNLSGRNAILIVPQGPKNAADANFGKMQDKGGFEAMAKQVVGYLHDQGKIPTTNIGHIVLTSHSGGYLAVSQILQVGGMRDKITDVLLMDSSYGGLEGYTDWIKLGENRRMISLFTEHLAATNVELMAMMTRNGVPFTVILDTDLSPQILSKRGMLFIHTLTLAHNDVIAKKNYYAEFLKSSALDGD